MKVLKNIRFVGKGSSIIAFTCIILLETALLLASGWKLDRIQIAYKDRILAEDYQREGMNLQEIREIIEEKEY